MDKYSLRSQGDGSDKEKKKKLMKFDFEAGGPPPDMRQRKLIFDSLSKIVTANPNKNRRKEQNADSRGTYIFTWGAGYQGQLGRRLDRGKKKYSAIPLPVDLNVVIRQVACGGVHTAVVTETGQVYTWGDGKNGELGHHHDPNLKQTPRLVENLNGVFVTYVACGGGHTVVLTDAGKHAVYACPSVFTKLSLVRLRGSNVIVLHPHIEADRCGVCSHGIN